MNMKNDLHDRLWRSFDRWLSVREQQGVSKHDLKVQGIQQHGDAQYHLRPLIFTKGTLRTYEQTLKSFVDYAKDRHGVTRLTDLKPRHMREWIKENIERAYAQKSLNRMRAAAAKLGTLIGKPESFARMSAKCGQLIRDAVSTGKVAAPARMTPSPELLRSALARLEHLDRAAASRTGQARGYSLAMRLQLETSARMVSVTERITRDSLREGFKVELVGKGGKHQTFTISQELHRGLSNHFAKQDGKLASYRGYRSAYARAMKSVGARVTGTHGARRFSIQDHRNDRYHELLRSGHSTAEAARIADGDAMDRLGHGRERQDHKAAYLGR